MREEVAECSRGDFVPQVRKGVCAGKCQEREAAKGPMDSRIY